MRRRRLPGTSGIPTREQQLARLRAVANDAQEKINLLERLPEGTLVRTASRMWLCRLCGNAILSKTMHVEDVRELLKDGKFGFARGAQSLRYCLTCAPRALAIPVDEVRRRIVVLNEEVKT